MSVPDSISVPDTNWYGQFALSVAIFSSVMSGILAVVYCGCRIGFPTDFASVFRLLGVSFLILNVPALGQKRWFAHPVVLILYTLAVLSVAGWFLYRLSAVGWVLSAVGYALFAWNLAAFASNFRTRLFLFILAIVAGLYSSGKTWGLGYNSPLAEERILIQNGHIDALFHASISNMMRTYGRPSTGLDGIPYIAYHYGSHWLVAALAPLCGFGTFDFYNSGTGILFTPLMYASLLFFAGAVRNAVRGPTLPCSNLSAGLLFWSVMLLGLVGPFPKKGDMMRVSLQEIYDSDSYALGLAVSFLVLGLLVVFYLEWRSASYPSEFLSGFALLLLFPILYAVCAIVKVSTAYLIGGILFYACIRLRLLRQRLVLFHLLISGALVLALAPFIFSRSDSRLAFFTFDRIHPEWVPFFFIFYFVWVWVFILVRTRQLHLHTLADVRRAFQGNDTFSVEILVLCALLGLLPYLALRFETGSWNYFTQYQTFLGLTLTAAYLPEWPSGWRQAHAHSFWDIRLSTVLAATVAVLLLVHLGTTTFASLYGLLKSNAEIRAELAGRSPDDWRRILGSLYGNSSGAFSPGLQSRQDMLACLQTLGKMPLEEKRKSVLYIPKSNRIYWSDLRQHTPSEGSVAFITPALTGIAMIHGEPEYDDLSETRRLDYGFWSYALPSRPEPATTGDDIEAMSRAKAMGFRQLIVVEGTGRTCAARITQLY